MNSAHTSVFMQHFGQAEELERAFEKTPDCAELLLELSCMGRDTVGSHLRAVRDLLGRHKLAFIQFFDQHIPEVQD